MSTYQLVVLSNPIQGKEAEFRTWYDDRHLQDLLDIPGIMGATRHERAGEGLWTSLAIYDIESDDPEQVIAEILRRWQTPAMPTSEAFDPNAYEMILMKKSKEIRH